jgi:hypothetical protein
MGDIYRLTILVWHHLGWTPEEIFDRYPSREYIVRRLLASGGDPSDVLADEMPSAERSEIVNAAFRISQLRAICPSLIRNHRTLRKD